MCADWLQQPPRVGGDSGGGNVRPGGMSDDENNSEYSDEFDFNDYDYGAADDREFDEDEPENVPFESLSLDPKDSQASGKPPMLLQPLRYAIIKGTRKNVEECLTKLKSQDFHINNTTLDDDWPALMFACQTPRPEILRFLIEQGANVKHITFENCTPLIALACANNQNGNFKDILECARILMDWGVEVNEAESSLGATALHFAVKNDHRELVEFLLQHDANVHQVDLKLRTPLHWAASHGLGPVIKILLKYNPDLECLTGSGLCAYEVAALSQGGYPEIARTLYLYQKSKQSKDQKIEDVDLSALTKNEISTEEKERRQRGSNRYGTTVERNNVESILSQIKLKTYYPNFAKEGIDLQRFLQLNDEDMVRIGVTNVGHRIRLMEVIRQMHNHDWKRSSLISFPPNSTITLPDATLFCKNVAYHVSLMRATLHYLAMHANRPSETSTLLNPGMDMSQKERFQTYCDKLRVTTDTLTKSTNLFHDTILKIKDNVEYKVGDYIGDPVDEK